MTLQKLQKWYMTYMAQDNLPLLLVVTTIRAGVRRLSLGLAWGGLLHATRSTQRIFRTSLSQIVRRSHRKEWFFFKPAEGLLLESLFLVTRLVFTSCLVFSHETEYEKYKLTSYFFPSVTWRFFSKSTHLSWLLASLPKFYHWRYIEVFSEVSC